MEPDGARGGNAQEMTGGLSVRAMPGSDIWPTGDQDPGV